MKITRRKLLWLITGSFMAVGNPTRLIAQGVNKKSQHNRAQLLTEKGHEQLDQGQYWEALDTWKEATNIYRQLGLPDGVTGNLINQNLALQALGLYTNACDVLLEALKIDKWSYSSTINSAEKSNQKALNTAIQIVEPTPVNLLGLRNLGDVLRLMGKLNESEIVLKGTLRLTQEIIPSEDVSPILLSCANTKKSIYERSRQQYNWIEEPVFKKEIVALIQENALASINYYQQVNTLATASEAIKVKSQIQQLSLLLDFEKWLTIEIQLGNQRLASIAVNINQKIQNSVNSIIKNTSGFSELPIIQSAYAKINFAESLAKISNEHFNSIAVDYVKAALQTAKTLKNQRLQSYSLGTLGKLKPEESRAYFEQALGFAQSIQAWDIVYQWQQQLGDLYSQEGKLKKASKFYEAAINSLIQVRANLLSSNYDTQFFFYEKVEPIYRNYMRLLLAEPSPKVEKIIQVNGQLQLEQLKNFLQCGKLDLVPLSNLQKLPNTASIINIIDLGDTIEVIVQSPDRSFHHKSVNANLLRNPVANLLGILQSYRFSTSSKFDIIIPCQKLYTLLIAPIKTYLPPSGTLVFALDTSFQSLPMGLLHDGKNYLVNQYSIANTLGSKIQAPKILRQEQLIALIAGLSKESPSFKDENAPKGLRALPKVAVEVADIKKETNSSTVLLNENFTSLEFQKKLTTNDFPIVHISTHGQFSSSSDKTVFLAYDKAINILEFDALLKNKAQSNENGIELLVLSACQTAKGNKRSTLGMAGTAAQAGAQSVIASLWLVDEDSTAILMQEFYKGLKNGLSKAEALRQAQLSLSSNPEYDHPYFWASFVLVGGWI